jgi:hypothetical protein
MANEDKSGTNLTSVSVVFVALASTGFYFFHHEAPLLDMRPIAEARLEECAAPQGVEARLWQDPIGAVDRARDARQAEQRCKGNPELSATPGRLPLEAARKKTLVLGVTVPGGPYAEDVEQRRRTRYAVLAGLHRAGYVPEDRRHIRYDMWPQLPASFLSERPPEPPLLACGAPSAEYFACVSAAPVRGVASAWPSFDALQGPRSNSVQALSGSASVEPPIIPYESFGKESQLGGAEDGNTPDHVLVLWLKDDFFIHQPLTVFSSLVELLNRGDPNIKFIGPSSSDMLHAMVSEALTQCGVTCSRAQFPWKNLEGMNFYAYLASAPDKSLFGNLCESCGVESFFEQAADIHLRRTVATEDTLAEGIRNELLLRHINPTPEQKINNLTFKTVEDDIVLISEWDTFYGQTLPKAVERAFAGDDSKHKWIHKFTYLRGLDGLVPPSGTKEDSKQDKSANREGKQGGTPDFFKVENDTESLERPIGESQYDYLRRIGARLHKLDDDLRKHTDARERQKKIKAIGILGGDVFDKLLILRALRPEFPEAQFFTTDFDEAFTIKSELPFTRNLIISSTFGPNLSEWLQGDIPFFRDTYQTSAFLATQLAVGNLHKKTQRPDYASSDIPDQLREPRIFEVNRSGEILPFAWVPPPPAPQASGIEPNDDKVNGNQVQAEQFPLREGRSVSTINWPLCREINGVKRCGNIQPLDPDELEQHPKPSDPKVIEKPFPALGEESSGQLAVGLAICALLGALALGFNAVRKHALVEMILLSLCLGAAAVACLNWETVGQYLTSDENGGLGEPVAIMDGISAWPTVFLRGLGLVLSAYFIYRMLRGLHINLAEIAADMELSPKPEPFLRQLTGIHYLIAFWAWLGILLGISPRSNERAGKTLVNVEDVWQAYVARERFWPRCLKAIVFALIMYMFSHYVLRPLFGGQMPPIRGERALEFYKDVTKLDVRLMDFLIYYVFDATLSCVRFIYGLRFAKLQWPNATAETYKGRFSLQPDLIHDWIGLEFVAKRTNCIGSLIYFPFVLIALLIVSRSTVFAGYAPSPVILIVQGICLFIVFSCAIMLWRAAGTTRDMAKQKLTDAIIRVKGAKILAGQLETLLVGVAELNEGAFGPLAKQPLVKALLLPLSSAGWVTLIQSGTLPGL